MWQEIVEKAKKVNVWNTDTVFTGEEIVYAANLMVNVLTHVEATRPIENVSVQTLVNTIRMDFLRENIDFADFWHVSYQLAERIQWFIKWMAKWHPDYDYTIFAVIPATFEQKELAAEINATLDANESVNEMLRTMNTTRYERKQAMQRLGLQRWQFIDENPNVYASLPK